MRDGDAGERAERTATVELAILLLPWSSLGSLHAAFEDFAAIGRYPGAPRPSRRFRPRIVSETGRPCATVAGAAGMPHGTLADAAAAEVVAIPSLLDDGRFPPRLGRPLLDAATAAWLRDRFEAGATLAAPCTAAFALAEAGLLDGREATTHWAYEALFAERHPQVRLLPRRAMVAAGPGGRLITGGSSVYVTDVNLALIARFAGMAAARHYARTFGKFWRGDLVDVYAREIDGPQVDDAAVAAAQAWMNENLHLPDLVRAAAAQANMTERTFSRRFRRATGATPGAYAALRRVERARELLEGTRLPVEEIAARVGFADPAGFRRAFARRAGLTPAEHRRRFKLPPAPEALR